jgi:hypothetical protein
MMFMAEICPFVKRKTIDEFQPYICTGIKILMEAVVSP